MFSRPRARGCLQYFSRGPLGVWASPRPFDVLAAARLRMWLPSVFSCQGPPSMRPQPRARGSGCLRFFHRGPFPVPGTSSRSGPFNAQAAARARMWLPLVFSPRARGVLGTSSRPRRCARGRARGAGCLRFFRRIGVWDVVWAVFVGPAGHSSRASSRPLLLMSHPHGHGDVVAFVGSPGLFPGRGTPAASGPAPPPQTSSKSVHLVSLHPSSLGLCGISCSAVLRCRRPDDDPSFMRAQVGRHCAWGMGAGRGAAATVSARERSWIRTQRRAPCLAAANHRWVRPFTPARRTPVMSHCDPSVARAPYPIEGTRWRPMCPFRPPSPLLWRGAALLWSSSALGGEPCRGLPFHQASLGVRELSRMRWMHRAGAPRPPRPVPRLAGCSLPPSMRWRSACPCALPLQNRGAAWGGDPASLEDVLPG